MNKPKSAPEIRPLKEVVSEFSIFTKVGALLIISLFLYAFLVTIFTPKALQPRLATESRSKKYRAGKKASREECINKIIQKTSAKNRHSSMHIGEGIKTTPYQLCQEVINEYKKHNEDFSKEQYQKLR